eukprot:4650744-Amphidinium_carterae.1
MSFVEPCIAKWSCSQVGRSAFIEPEVQGQLHQIDQHANESEHQENRSSKKHCRISRALMARGDTKR